MQFLDRLNLIIGEFVAVDGTLLKLSLLLLVGIAGHYALAHGIKRLNKTAARTSHRWDDVFASALEAPIRVVLWIVVGFLVMGLIPFLEELQTILTPAYDTVLVLLLTWFLRRLVSGAEVELLEESRGRTASTDKASVRATAKLLRVVIWMVAGLLVLQTLGVSVSGLLAFGGIGGIAVGFAAKDLLANFFGGLSIYLDRPFTNGDWIRSPDQEIEGTVEEIGWRLTRIRTFDQRPLYVPNAVFSQISVENPSRMHNRRIKETIGLRYQDADKMEIIVEQVREMLKNHEAIDPNRTLIVNFLSFGPFSLDFFIYTFTKTTQWVKFHAIKQDILLKILAIVHANDADVAFPTTTVQMEQISAEPDA